MRSHAFDPRRHEDQLLPIIRELRQAKAVDAEVLHRLVRRYPKEGRGAFSKSEIIRGYRFWAPRFGWSEEDEGFVDRLRMKPVRTMSGVAPVTVLTKPYPCPGKCIFCPNDVRMPKSYLASEPGAQRAAQHDFDPYGQTLSRLVAYHHNGHRVDKVELIVLGGTWSFYPEPYQIWFVKRCFEAMNDFAAVKDAFDPQTAKGVLSFAALDESVDGRALERSYNQVVRGYLRRRLGGELLDASEHATWEELAAAQRANESGAARCVGLVVETRPDHLSRQEAVRMRRLGATKVQIGFQSLSDEVLAKNHRGHDVAATRRAVRLLREGGFKLHAHWMPNLYGSDPRRDVDDFQKLFEDPDFRPDELKIYPCSLIESAELMQVYERGDWRPYTHEELLEVLSECLLRVPEYCRITRVVRDIPGDDILVGNKTTNFREVVETELHRRGQASRDIRAREIRGSRARPEELVLDACEYDTSLGREVFLQLITGERRIVGFCRLSLPRRPVAWPEIAASAMIREVHVYGSVVGIGESGGGRSQHSGLGRRLVEEAARRAVAAGFAELAVISAVGTRDYYRGLGFADGELYQHLAQTDSASQIQGMR